RTTPDADSLRMAVAQHIPDERERAAFVSRARAWTKPVRTTAGSVVATHASRGAGTGADAALSEAAQQAAVRALTAIVGPIGRVHVKRAVQRATTRAQFIELVADSVDADDRAQVVSALQ